MVPKDQYPNGRPGRSIAATRRILEKRRQSDRELCQRADPFFGFGPVCEDER